MLMITNVYAFFQPVVIVPATHLVMKKVNVNMDVKQDLKGKPVKVTAHSLLISISYWRFSYMAKKKKITPSFA